MAFRAIITLAAVSLVVGFCSPSLAADEVTQVDGKELFVREWIPQDPRSHGGDGLGPVFNDTSCVACHNQGGVGGAGPRSKNAVIITAFAGGPQFEVFPSHSEGALSRLVKSLAGNSNQPQDQPPQTDEEKAQAKQELARKQRERLAKIHPGFRTARSVVLQHFGTDDVYPQWRSRITGIGQHGINFHSIHGNIHAVPSVDERNAEVRERVDRATREMRVESTIARLQNESQFSAGNDFVGNPSIDGFVFILSGRNAIALFGSGQIDSIPDKALHELATVKHDEFPEITGRVAKLKDGRIGKFGWKGQKSSLNDFVLTACAVELGLNVPGEAQAGTPHQPTYESPGLDLNQPEVTALVSYIASLPAPAAHQPQDPKHAEFISGGEKLFTSVGCAACHTPNVAHVTGIYSDLLLHDLGPALGDTGEYGSFAPNATEEDELNEPVPPLVHNAGHAEAIAVRAEEPKDLIGALRLEWRTPPLWGVRDSAPYLHDGRAATLEQAIAMHGGESTKVARNFFALKNEERQQMLAFLRSLVAPGSH